MSYSMYNAKTFSFEKVFVVEHTGFDTYDLYNANVARYQNISISSLNIRLWGLRCVNWNWLFFSVDTNVNDCRNVLNAFLTTIL